MASWFLPRWLPTGASLRNVGRGIGDTDVLQYRLEGGSVLDVWESRSGTPSLSWGEPANAWEETLGERRVLVEPVKAHGGWFAGGSNGSLDLAMVPDTLRFSFVEDGTWVGLWEQGVEIPEEGLRRFVAGLHSVSRDGYVRAIAPWSWPPDNDSVMQAPRPSRDAI